MTKAEVNLRLFRSQLYVIPFSDSLLLITFIATSEESIPINLRPNFAAAKSVVPLPAKQSIIILFSLDDCLIINSSISRFFCVGYLKFNSQYIFKFSATIYCR